MFLISALFLSVHFFPKSCLSLVLVFTYWICLWVVVCDAVIFRIVVDFMNLSVFLQIENMNDFSIILPRRCSCRGYLELHIVCLWYLSLSSTIIVFKDWYCWCFSGRHFNYFIHNTSQSSRFYKASKSKYGKSCIISVIKKYLRINTHRNCTIFEYLKS